MVVCMSGGAPVGSVRQRHSQGFSFALNTDDLEDDASSRVRPPAPSSPRGWTKVEIVENLLWLVSAAFIVYYGDGYSNLIYLLLQDARIKRMPLYLGMVGVAANVIIFSYTSMSAWSGRRFDEKWEITSISALPIATILALASFCLFNFALWTIWSFLCLPLLFTLFMAGMVIFPYTVIGTFRLQNDEFRTD